MNKFCKYDKGLSNCMITNILWSPSSTTLATLSISDKVYLNVEKFTWPAMKGWPHWYTDTVLGTPRFTHDTESARRSDCLGLEVYHSAHQTGQEDHQCTPHNIQCTYAMQYTQYTPSSHQGVRSNSLLTQYGNPNKNDYVGYCISLHNLYNQTRCILYYTKKINHGYKMTPGCTITILPHS